MRLVKGVWPDGEVVEIRLQNMNLQGGDEVGRVELLTGSLSSKIVVTGKSVIVFN